MRFGHIKLQIIVLIFFFNFFLISWFYFSLTVLKIIYVTEFFMTSVLTSLVLSVWKLFFHVCQKYNWRFLSVNHETHYKNHKKLFIIDWSTIRVLITLIYDKTTLHYKYMLTIQNNLLKTTNYFKQFN